MRILLSHNFQHRGDVELYKLDFLPLDLSALNRWQLAYISAEGHSYNAECLVYHVVNLSELVVCINEHLRVCHTDTIGDCRVT